jgi:amino acid transporter
MVAFQTLRSRTRRSSRYHQFNLQKKINGVAFGKDPSLEQGITEYVVRADRYHFDAADLVHVQRRLKQHHVQMIAIAGTIGTGLFLGSGRALSGADPLGALIAYALVGTVAYSSLCSVGEMTTHAPISGTFLHFAVRWVDPAFGFSASLVIVSSKVSI